MSVVSALFLLLLLSRYPFLYVQVACQKNVTRIDAVAALLRRSRDTREGILNTRSNRTIAHLKVADDQSRRSTVFVGGQSRRKGLPDTA